MSSVLGIDLGGTKIAAARYTLSTFAVEELIKVDTEASEGMLHVLEKLQSVLRTLQTDDTTAVGIGVPGLVRTNGTVQKMPNIPESENVDIAKELALHCSLPIYIENDANCFALAEALFGAGKNKPLVTAVTLGTGVGGGIIVDGKIFRGADGYAAEFGHMLLQPGVVPYQTQDVRGDVEQYVSGTAMGKRCKQADSPEEYLDGAVCEFMLTDIIREVAWLCTNITHMLNPSIIVLGGSAGRALTKHVPAIQTELAKWVLPGTPLPEISIAQLDDAATRGAAALCRNLD